MAGLWHKPQLPGNLTFAGGEADLAEIARAAHENMVLVDNTIAATAARERAYDDAIDEIRAATGQALENPYRKAGWPEGEELARLNAKRANGADTDILRVRRELFAEKVQELARQNPTKRETLIKSLDMEARAQRLARSAGRRLDEAMASRTDVLAPMAASFAGGAMGSLRDPVQLYTLIAGGGPGAARTIGGRIARTALSEALVNGASEAAMQPFVQDWRAKVGLPAGFDEAAKNVAFATALGGLFGAAGRSAGELLDKGGARAMPEMQPEMPPDARPVAPPEAQPEAQPRSVPEMAPEAPARAAMADDIKAGQALEPIREALPAEARGAVDALESERLADEASAPLVGKVDPGEHEAASIAALRRAEETDDLEPRPVEAPVEHGGDALARPVPPVRGLDDPAGPEAVAATEDLLAGIQNEADMARQRRIVAQVAGPAPKKALSPVSITQFLAGEGIADFKGELKSLGEGRIFIPGAGPLIRDGGRSLDYAREAAAEAGYLHGFGSQAEAVQKSTIADLLAAIDSDLRGEKVYSVQDGEAVTAFEDFTKASAERQVIRGFVDEVDRIAEKQLDDAFVARAVQIMAATRDAGGQSTIDAFDALERAIMEDHYSDTPMVPFQARGKDWESLDAIPFETGNAGQRQPLSTRGAEDAAGTGAAAGKSGEGAGSAGGKASATEPGAEGKDQLLIDGIAPVTQAARDRAAIERRAAAPLSKGNKEADFGLFGPERDQTDFADIELPVGVRSDVDGRMVVETRRLGDELADAGRTQDMADLLRSCKE